MIEELEKAVKRLEKYDDTTILKFLREEDIKEIERLHSIIKEVREYIEENMSYIEKGKLEYIPSGEELLEILKGSDKE